jgi:crotonobetainyl-CoA:carnitine CoA-transferase CaiB-like acyl-CoA transferase
MRPPQLSSVGSLAQSYTSTAVQDDPVLTDGQLAGVRVLDFGIWRPAPYATQLLADLGADVIHVEPPGGDPMRTFPPLFATLSSHKRCVEVDLKRSDELARVLDLARDADVVVEGFRPGVAARLGIGWEAIHAVNPRAVFCSISGFGQDGDLAQVPGHDINYQALSGMLQELGSTVPSVPIADIGAGLAAAFAICAALVRAGRTGEGEQIDVAMADVMATWTGPLEAAQMRTGGAQGAGEGAAGYGVYDTADGQLVLGVVTEDPFWRAVCAVLDLDELSGCSFAERSARAGELNAVLAQRLAGRKRDEVVGELAAGGVPASPVLRRAEVMDSEHFRRRGVVVGSTMAHPVRFGAAPARPPADPRPPERDLAWLPR